MFVNGTHKPLAGFGRSFCVEGSVHWLGQPPLLTQTSAPNLPIVTPFFDAALLIYLSTGLLLIVDPLPDPAPTWKTPGSFWESSCSFAPIANGRRKSNFMATAELLLLPLPKLMVGDVDEGSKSA